MATPVDFPKYLQSLVESYQKQQHLYTLTDLQVEVRMEMPPEELSNSVMSSCEAKKLDITPSAKNNRSEAKYWIQALTLKRAEATEILRTERIWVTSKF
ncbi:hypothetical protein [Microcoleus sp. EPA2]|uniref:hypothetical protein n=1 Tax=Microcoleus sp. EPA2 TaxID=2841654 RepID=UPI00312B3ACC